MVPVLDNSNGCNRDPTQNHDCHRQPDFFQSVYNGRIEVKRMCVIDGARVLSVQDEREIVHVSCGRASWPRDWSHMKAAQAFAPSSNLTPAARSSTSTPSHLARPSPRHPFQSHHLVGVLWRKSRQNGGSETDVGEFAEGAGAGSAERTEVSEYQLHELEVVETESSIGSEEAQQEAVPVLEEHWAVWRDCSRWEAGSGSSTTPCSTVSTRLSKSSGLSNYVRSRRWSSSNQIHARRRSGHRHLRRRHAHPDPLVRNTHHLRRPRKTPKRSLINRHEGLADGEHHLPCPLKASYRCTATDIPDAWDRLR